MPGSATWAPVGAAAALVSRRRTRSSGLGVFSAETCLGGRPPRFHDLPEAASATSRGSAPRSSMNVCIFACTNCPLMSSRDVGPRWRPPAMLLTWCCRLPGCSADIQRHSDLLSRMDFKRCRPYQRAHQSRHSTRGICLCSSTFTSAVSCSN